MLALDIQPDSVLKRHGKSGQDLILHNVCAYFLYVQRQRIGTVKMFTALRQLFLR